MVKAAACAVFPISIGSAVGVPWGAQALASKMNTTPMSNMFRFIPGFTFEGFDVVLMD
jgi:hypothetical protein